MSQRAIVRLTWWLFALGMLLTAATLFLGFGRGDSGAGLTSFAGDLIWFLSLTMFVPVGALIASRHPRNPVGWIFLAIGLSEVLSKFAYEYAAYSLITNPGALPGGGAMAWLQSWTWAPELTLFPFLILLFPDGRLLSRWWGAVGWVPLAWMLAFLGYSVALWPHRGVLLLRNVESFGIDSLAPIEARLFALFPAVMLCLAASLVCLIIRFRRSRGEQRQQLKWIALTAGLGATNILVSNLILDPLGLENRATTLLGETLGGPGLFAIAAGVAMLKYRLFDIDRIINRALVYGALTAFLALIYLGGVIGLGGAVRSLTGQQSNNLAVAASTLAVAGLFRPVRGRLQSFIDRRFYRRKYDASRTMESFSSQLREEVDLNALSGHLVGVVQETMQPAHVSLWLRSGAEAR
ncbi:MAG: hypothetical protein M3456_03085 [Actinomycetota bacterium]|nr:hypothetical protein [Actinomycetota bacterium]